MPTVNRWSECGCGQTWWGKWRRRSTRAWFSSLPWDDSGKWHPWWVLPTVPYIDGCRDGCLDGVAILDGWLADCTPSRSGPVSPPPLSPCSSKYSPSLPTVVWTHPHSWIRSTLSPPLPPYSSGNLRNLLICLGFCLSFQIELSFLLSIALVVLLLLCIGFYLLAFWNPLEFHAVLSVILFAFLSFRLFVGNLGDLVVIDRLLFRLNEIGLLLLSYLVFFNYILCYQCIFDSFN